MKRFNSLAPPFLFRFIMKCFSFNIVVSFHLPTWSDLPCILAKNHKSHPKPRQMFLLLRPWASNNSLMTLHLLRSHFILLFLLKHVWLREFYSKGSTGGKEKSIRSHSRVFRQHVMKRTKVSFDLIATITFFLCLEKWLDAFNLKEETGEIDFEWKRACWEMIAASLFHYLISWITMERKKMENELTWSFCLKVSLCSFRSNKNVRAAQRYNYSSSAPSDPIGLKPTDYCLFLSLIILS